MESRNGKVLFVLGCILTLCREGSPESGTAFAQARASNPTAARSPNAPEYKTLIAQGQACREKREFARAVECFGRAIALQPQNPEGYLERSEAYLAQFHQKHQFEEHQYLVHFSDSRQPGDDANQPPNDGADSAGLGGPDSTELERARDDIYQAKRLAPADRRVRRALGALDIEVKLYGRAITRFDSLIQEDPSDVETLMLRGNLYLQQHEYEKAVADFSTVIRLAPDNADAFGFRADTLVFLRKYSEALSDLDRVARLEPDNPGVYNVRGVIYAQQGKYEQAVEDLTIFLRHEPNNVFGLKQRAAIYTRQRNYEGALADLTEAIRLSPDSAGLYWNRAKVLAGAKRIEDALADLDQAARLLPDSVECQEVRANALQSLGRSKEAELARKRALWLEELLKCRVALRRQPNGSDVWLAYAEHLAMGDRLVPAMAAYNRALELNSASANAHLGRAKLWLRKQEYHKAAEDATAALRLVPSDSARAVLAEAYIGLGDYDRAIVEYERLFMAETDLARAYLLRSKQHTAQGRQAEAAEDRRRALQLDPNIEAARP